MKAKIYNKIVLFSQLRLSSSVIYIFWGWGGRSAWGHRATPDGSWGPFGSETGHKAHSSAPAYFFVVAVLGIGPRPVQVQGK